MDNHYHLFIETTESNLSQGIHYLNSAYANWFRSKHKTIGPLFQGRFKSILVDADNYALILSVYIRHKVTLVDKDNYLLVLCRYVVLNPIRAKIVKDPKDNKWSSYLTTISYHQGIPCLTTNWIISQFGQEPKKAERQYQIFVYDRIKAASPLKAIKEQLFLGQENFIDKKNT